MVPLARLTSVQGAFRARVVAAALAAEGLDPVLRGADDGPYGASVGALARVEVYVPEDQIEDASLVLLEAEIDETLALSDPDVEAGARLRSPALRGIAVATLIALVGAPLLRFLSLGFD